jgi:hypothetical protein
VSQPDVPAGRLTGRTGELDFLEGFFLRAAVSGGALLLSGDPGVGKTALLNVLADFASASGTTVLRVAGVEFEGDVSFAGLNQALFPSSATSTNSAPRTGTRCAWPWGSEPGLRQTGCWCPTPR